MYPTEVVAVVLETGPLWERLLSSMTQLSPGQQLPCLTLHFLKVMNLAWVTRIAMAHPVGV